MPRKSRDYISTSFFHVMIQGINKEYIFGKDVDKNQYLKFINKIEGNVDVIIISYCVMDNHVHLLVKADFTEELSKFMHKVNTLYAIYYNNKYDRVGYVFRDRYKSQIIYSEKQLYTCINYIHNNPVKAKICEFPYQYEYSSFKEYNKKIEQYQKVIKENVLKAKTFLQEQDVVFLEDENDKEKEIGNAIDEYLCSNKLNLDKLMKDREHLKEIIILLRDTHNLSLRKIAEYLDIGRETIRAISKGLSKKGVPIDKLKGDKKNE